jgi:hydrogenase-4 membrane subunit HyfE
MPAVADPGPLSTIIDILAVVMVLIALGIVSVGAIQQMIRLYQIQSVILALLTGLVAFDLGTRDPATTDVGTSVLLAAFAVIIPGMLAYIIEPLLAQATVPREMAPQQRLAYPFLRLLSRYYREEAARSIREALPVWLEHGLSSRRQRSSAAISLLLTASAYIFAQSLLGGPGVEARSLAVSMTLLMLGMFTMINRQDLISQVMGLLVMDHGLFLAAVRVITLPSLIATFVVSLFLYILITLVILVILLPELHERSATIEVADQRELRG